MYRDLEIKEDITDLSIYTWSYISCSKRGKASRRHRKFFDKRDTYGPSSFTAICTYMTHPHLAPPTVVNLNS